MAPVPGPAQATVPQKPWARYRNRLGCLHADRVALQRHPTILFLIPTQEKPRPQLPLIFDTQINMISPPGHPHSRGT